ncbi:hypothetical protein [Haladaptatus sp. DFWS20]|uniref:hypothetical protein n=1 Tax=Haladaptatus sp. DFWS20 TaxID=3403467 RepID=UPI003EB8C47F
MKRLPFDSSRRQALHMVGVSGIAAVAGCLTPSSPTNSCTEDMDVSLQKVTNAHVSNEFSSVVNGAPYATDTVVSDAFDTGKATSRGYYSPELRTEYVAAGSEPRYYRVTTTEHDRTKTTGYEYAVKIGIDDSTLSNDDTVRFFPDLPAQDRESIHSAIGNKEKLHAPHFTSFSVVFAYEHDAVREQSMFVPNTGVQYVEWEGTVLRFKFEEERTVQITSTTVMTERVAESSSGFFEHVRDERGVVLDSLTSRQREIVTRAIEDGYSECKPYSEPYADLLDQLRMSDGEFALLAQYDSQWYFTQIHQRTR